ncbi:MAG: DUF4157 domain-containing protein [Gallionella sp.]
MQRAQKQGSESENAQRTMQAKFTSKSRENEQANAIDDSPAMIAQRKKLNSLFGGAIQRVEDEEPLQGKFETAQRVEEEEPLQGKFEAVQRVEEEEPLQGKFEAVQRVEEEESLQGKFETAQRVEEEEPLQGKFEAATSVQLKEEVAKPNNTGLPDNLKSGIENLSGMSMDNVKVHYNSSQPAQLNALAYAQGTDIHVAPRQEQHLPHEAWHVVQQAQGRVKPTMQMKEGVPVNDDRGLEHEADVMGAKAKQAGTMQLKRTVAFPQIDFTFDGSGIMTSPPSHGDTDPTPRSKWLNEKMTAGLLVGNNGNGSYINGHQVAHRWSGENDGDCVGAWSQQDEADYTALELSVDGANKTGAPNETGSLNVTTDFKDDGWVADDLLNETWTTAQTAFKDKTKWTLMGGGGNPTTDAPETEVKAEIKKIYTKDPYKDGAQKHIVEAVTFNYQSDQGRTNNLGKRNITAPTWSTTSGDYENYFKNKLFVSWGGGRSKYTG